MKHNSPGCATTDCCENPCPCGVSGDPVVGTYGTISVTIANVAMNGLSPPMCDPPRSGLTIDETWYNGVTFQFRHEWTLAQIASNNPNGYDVVDNAYAPTVRCIQQSGYWQCFYTATDFFWWGIACTIGKALTFAGSHYFGYRIILQCGLGSTSSGSPVLSSVTSQGSIYYYNTTATGDIVHPCHTPAGSYVFLARDGIPFGSINTGPFDFRAFTVSAVSFT